ncbi:MAG: hypothetical protein QOJ01_1961 [Solirubrobacterales bacterium]|nr:hypothetical protein [Solirubrobacterales bacterium]
MPAESLCDGSRLRLRRGRVAIPWALAVVGTLAVFVVGARPAEAAPLAVPHSQELRGIACPTAKLCDAVGINQAGTKAIVVPIHVRTGETDTEVDAAVPIPDLQLGMAIACPSAKLCEVLGQTDTGDVEVVPVTPHDPHPGAAVPLPGLGVGAAIACPQRDLCDIAGWTSAFQGAVVPFDVPSATAGTAQIVPQAARLAGIACPNTTTCIASGTTAPLSGGTGEVVGVDAATGTAQGATNEPGTEALGATACPTADRCFAVGASATDAVVVNVSSYDTPGEVQTPPHGHGIYFYSLACPRMFVCQGVGSDATNTGAAASITHGIAESPTEIRSTNYLQAIACPTSSDCLRVGSGSDGGIVAPQRAVDPSPNRPDGANCQGQRRGNDPNFAAVTDSLPHDVGSNLDAISTTISSAPACRDPKSDPPTSAWDMLQVPVNDSILNAHPDKQAFVQGGIFYADDGSNHPFVELAYPPLRTPIPEWHDSAISVHEGGSENNPAAHVDVTFTGSPAPNPDASSGRFGIEVGNLTQAPTTCGWVPASKQDEYEKYEGNRPSAGSPKAEITLTLNGKCLWKFYMGAGFANDLWWGNLAVELHSTRARAPGTYSDPVAFRDTVVSYGGSSTDFVPQLQPDDPELGASPFLRPPGTCQLHSPGGAPSWSFYVWNENDRGACNPWEG